MQFLDSLESRFGRFALSGMIQAVGVLQLVTAVIYFSLPDTIQTHWAGLLSFDLFAFAEGQVWRLLTHFLLPFQSPLFAVLGALAMIWIGRAIEEAWGPFRVNLYLIACIFTQTVAALLAGGMGAFWLHLSTFFVFATLFPNEEILFMFILPVKARWLAIFMAIYLALMVLKAWALLLIMIPGLGVYGVIFLPGLLSNVRHQSQVTARRTRFNEAAQPQAAFFHQCSVCGKTEVDDSSLEFRVNVQGDEICSICRSKAQA